MDRDLVEQARRGDREAFAVLVHQVSDSLYAVAQRILRDSGLAEDALQNALVLAWRRIPHLREPDRFEAWIHRILVHACYDESQRARQWTANVRVLPIDGPTTPDGSAVVADRDELERAFRRLPVDQRAVFVLHHYLGLPLVEIAEMLEIPAGTARSRLHYATRALREALTAEPDRPSPEDVWHDRRSLARTRRSLVARGRTDPGARPRRGGRPPPDRNDFTGTGSSDPVEVAQDDHTCPRCCGRRDRRARDRRRLLHALTGRSIQCRRPRPIAQRSALGERGALGVERARARRCARDHPWRLASDVRWRHHRSVRRQRAHPTLRRLAGWPPHVDPDDRRRSGPQVGDLAGTSR